MCIRKKKLMFVIYSMAGGGAEKVLLDIISNLDEKSYRVMLVLFNAEGILMEKIPQSIEVFDLKRKSKYSVFIIIFKLALLIRKLKPDNVIGFMHYANMITVLSARLSGIKTNLIITIHNNIIAVLDRSWLGPIKFFLYKHTFNQANKVTVPSEGIKKMMVDDFQIKLNKIKTIPHPLLIDEITRLSNEDLEPVFKDKNYILSVGRLTEQKGYKYLLKAFQIISVKNNYYLIILGVGRDKQMLEELTNELNLSNRVIFAGFQKNPYKFMKNSSLFVLSSLFESFGVVLSEAMICGTPIVSTDCPSGPGELINNEVNGLLVTPCNVVELANAMDRVLNNENDARNFRAEGFKKAYSLNVNNIIPLYERLFV
ncbi:MAG: glycosyltransferase [archaeon]|nr:glycosyltransferase [archaeon]